MKKNQLGPIGQKTSRRAIQVVVPAPAETPVLGTAMPPTAEKEPDVAMEAFEELPAETKELVRLQDESEKTCGPKAAVLTRRIRTLGA